MEGYKSCVHLFEKIKAGSPFKKRTAHYGAIYGGRQPWTDRARNC
jgi:hypothetical protein